MRLFYAIEFEPAFRKMLWEQATCLRCQVYGGRWTCAEHLHLTLVFLGEIPHEQLDSYCEAMRQAAFAEVPFKMEIAGCGFFGRKEAVLWLGICNPAVICRLAAALRAALRQKDLAHDQKPFQPHITIARQVNLLEKEPEWTDKKLFYTVKQVSLLESIRENGRLVYRTLLRSNLGGS
jgi:2'-5' RNA ligase